MWLLDKMLTRLIRKGRLNIIDHDGKAYTYGDPCADPLTIRLTDKGAAMHIARDPRGYILTGDDVVKARRWSHDRDPYLLESSVPGVFACGDVRLSPVKRVASAVGEGSMAIAFVHQYLAHEARSGRGGA